MEQVETVKQLEKQIAEAKQHLNDLEKKLYDAQNQELFGHAEANVGKCFRLKHPDTGCDQYLRIEGINKSRKTYIVRNVNVTTTRIGWSDFSINYDEINFRTLEITLDLWNKYEEINDENFVNFVNNEIEFQLKALMGKY